MHWLVLAGSFTRPGSWSPCFQYLSVLLTSRTNIHSHRRMWSGMRCSTQVPWDLPMTRHIWRPVWFSSTHLGFVPQAQCLRQCGCQELFSWLHESAPFSGHNRIVAQKLLMVSVFLSFGVCQPKMIPELFDMFKKIEGLDITQVDCCPNANVHVWHVAVWLW